MNANNDEIKIEWKETKKRMKDFQERIEREKTPCAHTQTGKKVPNSSATLRILYRPKLKSTTLFDCVIDNQWIFDALKMKSMTREKNRMVCKFTIFDAGSEWYVY